ncbi:mycothiol synthase [uncultured Leifsonia sp.]|uniref:mycothiol synthase n=1 Tax=uncultured Leifsonia sp. TaxID=340359 RepID=UPI0028D2CB42|nr:mycothiol synthase [uncultured Leifsonia sp.]
MTASLRLSVPDLAVPAERDAFFALAAAAAEADGADAFDEQTRLDLISGRRTPWIAHDTTGGTCAAAALGAGALDLVVAPAARRRGVGRQALSALLEEVPRGPLTAWSHGDHPGARRLASRFGFTAARTLLGMAMTLDGATGRAAPPHGFSLDRFRPGRDDAEWVALNQRTFASHPEQGAMTAADLHERMAEPWFDADDFLVLRDPDGRMVGYDWLKAEGARTGEVYVLGVDPAFSGRGLGRVLLMAGLARLRERGLATATLYVEGDNEAALWLYRSAGFGVSSTDVQYRRSSPVYPGP